MNAAASERTHRRATHMAARPEHAGAAMSATLSDAIGPNAAVTGRSRNDQNVTDVFESRLMPIGWNIADE